MHLTHDRVQFRGVSPANPDRPIAFDFAPPLGDGQGYNGLELLLMSLAGCSGTTVAPLLTFQEATGSFLEGRRPCGETNRQ